MSNPSEKKPETPSARKQRRSRADYDSPWKEAIEQLFPQFMAFFFPSAFAEIDWAQEPIFMDKELQKIFPDSATGGQVVDKLVKVWLRDGQQTLILIHIEVQSKKEDDFDRRMFVYNTTLYLTLGETVVSLAILADESESWHPQSYSYGHWGFTMAMNFPAIKLLAYREQWTALEREDNPFAMVVMAYLKAQETRTDDQDRLRWKINLVRMLYAKEYTRKQIYELLRFVHWVLVLPAELENQFESNVREFQEEKMKYIPEFLQDAMEDGALLNAREMVTEALTIRFQNAPDDLIRTVQAIEELDLLKEVQRRILTASSLQEVVQFVDEAQQTA